MNRFESVRSEFVRNFSQRFVNGLVRLDVDRA